jgi:hypothetical protein
MRRIAARFARIGRVLRTRTNIRSQETVTINRFVDIVAEIADKPIGKRQIPEPRAYADATPITGSSGKDCVANRPSRGAW